MKQLRGPIAACLVATLGAPACIVSESEVQQISCPSAGPCIPPSQIDGRKDADESDIDCGGSQSPPCMEGRACIRDGNCASGACVGGVCSAPPPTAVVDAGTGGQTTDCETTGTCVPSSESASGSSGSSGSGNGFCQGEESDPSFCPLR
jgi:hypothetical protein